MTVEHQLITKETKPFLEVGGKVKLSEKFGEIVADYKTNRQDVTKEEIFKMTYNHLVTQAVAARMVDELSEEELEKYKKEFKKWKDNQK